MSEPLVKLLLTAILSNVMQYWPLSLGVPHVRNTLQTIVTLQTSKSLYFSVCCSASLFVHYCKWGKRAHPKPEWKSTPEIFIRYLKMFFFFLIGSENKMTSETKNIGYKNLLLKCGKLHSPAPTLWRDAVCGPSSALAQDHSLQMKAYNWLYTSLALIT